MSHLTSWSVRRHSGVAHLTFARPPRNFMSFAAMEELHHELLSYDGDPDVRVVVLRSATPGYFVAHGALEDLIAIGRGEPPSGDTRIWGRTLNLIERMAQPVVASINGQAGGGGCEITLACAVRIASPHATFSQPEVDLGVLPGAGGTVRLAQHVGLGRAMEMILSGRRVDAGEALELGLVQLLLPVEGFDERVSEWAEHLARKPPAALRAAKAAVHFSYQHPQREALLNEARLFLELESSAETQNLQRRVMDVYDRTPAEGPVDLAQLEQI